MIAYKGFERGLICRGYQFMMGKNITRQANCMKDGFHCAENPLDCLQYYPDMTKSVYCIVDAGGDMDEDDIDSKIACTELTILKQITKKEFFLHALAYMADHPLRPWHTSVKKDRAAASGGFAIARGADPVACSAKGDILAFAKEDGKTGRVIRIALTAVDGRQIRPGIWYDTDFNERGSTK